MEITKEQIQELRSLKELPDDDNIRVKEIIKKNLIQDPIILYLLNNKELEENDADPTDYINVNILNNYLIHPTLYNVQNFICLGTESIVSNITSESIKILRVIFYILCNEKTNIESVTGIGRHDLIASRVKKMFNYTNKFGLQCELVDEKESITDDDYATRTLIFEVETANNIVKTDDGISRIMNFVGE